MEAKRTQQEKDNILTSISVFLAILIVAGLAIWFFSKPSGSTNDFCIEQGYKKATSSRLYGNPLDEVRIRKIECDKQEIFITERIVGCYSKDKWGDCLSHNFTYILSNNTGENLE